MSKPRILVLPLSNVLGHLTRTFSISEELANQKAEVHIACDDYYSRLISELPEEITVHSLLEMPVQSSRSFGKIASFDNGKEYDLLNLQNGQTLAPNDRKHRSQRLKEIIKKDKELLAYLQPDLIVTDYHFSVTLLDQIPENKIFHITNILGYASLYHRVYGNIFSPLNYGNLLVPGIQSLEEEKPSTFTANNPIHWCGPFTWQGWKRLSKGDPIPPKLDILLCFGSTGNEAVLAPWLVKNIESKYQLGIRSNNNELRNLRIHLYISNIGNLDNWIQQSNLVCCHGGHGTVMKCILEKKPMLVFPNNLEQLEIGKRIEKLGLGKVMDKPMEKLEVDDLNETIQQLLDDPQFHISLEIYSSQLKETKGAEKAASILLESIAYD